MFDRLTENWVLKLLSLISALVLWFFVMGERKVEVGYAVPLELKNVPKGMIVTNEVPNLVEVRLSGPRTMLMNLSPKDISISVDLADLKPGLTTFKRLEERLSIPGGLKVTRLSPAFIDVQLEQLVEKALPVRVELTGKPAEGLRVAGVEVNPEQLMVEGVASEFREVHEVSTEPVDVTGATESFTRTVGVNFRGRFISRREQGPVQVRVTVEPAAQPETSRNVRRSR
jgi:YbbR domain-containing protein